MIAKRKCYIIITYVLNLAEIVVGSVLKIILPQEVITKRKCYIIKQPSPRWVAYCIPHGPPQLFVSKIATNLSTSAPSYFT